MKSILDWKIWVPMILTVVLVPIAQLDWTPKKPQIQVVSVAPLLASKESGLEFKVTHAGVELKNPVLSVVEISNAGGKPIASADFEAPIVIKVGKQTTIQRAVIESRSPEALSPSLAASASALEIKPLLLNQGDKFTISLLTDGPAPDFSATARIVGVSDVQVSMGVVGGKTKRRLFFNALLAVPLAACYALLLFGAFAFRLTWFFKGFIALLGISCAFAAIRLTTPYVKSQITDGMVMQVAVATCPLLLALALLVPFHLAYTQRIAFWRDPSRKFGF